MTLTRSTHNCKVISRSIMDIVVVCSITDCIEQALVISSRFLRNEQKCIEYSCLGSPSAPFPRRNPRWIPSFVRCLMLDKGSNSRLRMCTTGIISTYTGDMFGLFNIGSRERTTSGQHHRKRQEYVFRCCMMSQQ